MVVFVLLAMVWIVAGVPVGGVILNRLSDWLDKTGRRGIWNALFVLPFGIYALVLWWFVRSAFQGTH